MKNLLYYYFQTFLQTSLLAFLSLPVYAATTLENPIKAETIEGLLRALVGVAIVFAAPIVVVFIIYAGFLYVTARGNEQQVQKAHQALLYAIIGGLLILGAFIIMQVVSNLITSIAA